MRIATIDIGTNSVLLTIAEKQADGSLSALVEEAHITRIGEGLATGDTFTAAAMERTATLLERYAGRCRELSVDRIRAVGTAAFRRVTNAQAFIDDVQARCGLAIEVISGEREATLSYQAVAPEFGEDILVLDIGGGSTELIWSGHALSLPLGSVVLHEQFCHSDPISDADFEQTRKAICSKLDSAGLPKAPAPARLVALAGTATTLAAMHLRLATYSHDQVHGTKLREADLLALLNTLRRATLAERKQMPGLEPARADVVLCGAILLHETMRRFGYDRVTVSDRGVRWGLLYEMV